MPASLLSDGTLKLTNVPKLSDIDTMSDLLTSLGCEIGSDKQVGTLNLKVREITNMIDLTKTVGLNLHKRSRAEIRFQSLGIISILISLGFLAWLLITILAGSLGAAKHVEINIPVNLSADKVDPNNIRDASFGSIIKSGLRSRFS